jgi:NTE family protein
VASKRDDPQALGAHGSVSPARADVPGQVVLVLQGGGALGAYHAGVYQALHESGIAPHWVIGTSIGAVNGALIAANRPEHRLERLHAFWQRVEKCSPLVMAGLGPTARRFFSNLDTLMLGVPGFFAPNPRAWLGPDACVGVEAASWYTTEQLHDSLCSLIDVGVLADKLTRLTVGAVNARTGSMRYFDSRDEKLGIEHVMASGALPPAFAAVRIDGEPYWDGGLYSNTPIEAVLDDKPRRDSVIFTVDVWRPDGEEPQSIWQVSGRQKDIQYASRADSHIARQKQIHHLRHVVRELARHLPAKQRESEAMKELASWGCHTTMHVIPLLASRLDGEDQTKDIDFTPSGVRRRWQAGRDDTLRIIARAPWSAPVNPIEGVIVHRL